MPIPFNEVPANTRLPWVYVEFDASQAVQGPQLLAYKGILIGQKTSAGTKAALTPARITSADQAARLFGVGSVLHNMAQAWFASNTFTEVWAVAFADPDAGVAATSTITFTGAPTESGTYTLYIAGRRVQVGITAAMTVTQMATAAAAAINLVTDLPVTATSALGVVTLTAKHKGLFTNDITVMDNYFGEKTPAGMVSTLTQPSGGTGLPDLTTLWPVLGDKFYNIWTSPYNDTASLADANAQLLIRSGPTRQVDAVQFNGIKGTFSTVTAFGEGQNKQFVNFMATQQSPSPSYEWGAETAAIAANYGQRDPARPFQTLAYSWVKSPILANRFIQSERNLCLFSGISTFHVGPDGLPVIDRLITSYQQNNNGAEDTAYMDLNTILTLSYLRYDFRNHILRKYPRHKLANDGTKYGAGQPIVTPKVIKAECIAKFREWEYIGLVEGMDQFKRDLIVERNVTDPTRLDIYLPPDLINQLIVVGVQIGFRLQSVSID